MREHCRYQLGKLSSHFVIQVFLLLGFTCISARPANSQISVTTYHYDNNRTGWNKNETVLTPTNVASPLFGLVMQPILLDDQVDAQPLVVPGVSITAGSYKNTTHDVVYVATEKNTVYAIDAHTGTVLLSANFGAPVPSPLGCNNNGPNVGITSTPVIDSTSKTLYVMAYTNDGPTYRLHALNLGSLTERANAPVTVAATHALYPAGTFTFNAQYQRQRPALLLANGNVYAGFGSFCDYDGNVSRGWLLGWTALNSSGQGSIEPLAANQLLDYQETDADSFFLASIWMSGYGPATDDAGNVLFVTGNSRGYAYTGTTDIQESVVKVAPSLTNIVDLFTPDTMESLDDNDYDFGSGGVLVLPDQPGSVPHMAVAAGKDGNMYFMNEDHLGGYSPTSNNVLGTYFIGNCWCGESYYVDSTDGLGRVVTSGGTGSPVDGPALANTLEVWKVQTTPSVALTQLASAQLGGTAQGPGFFTSISSNGTASPIIWAITRAAGNTDPVMNLLAFNPASNALTQISIAPAVGYWPSLGGNANLVPVVANGQVFFASYQQLLILGMNPTTPDITFLPAHNANVIPGPPAGYQVASLTVKNTTAYTMVVTYGGTNGFTVGPRPVGRGYQCYGQPLAPNTSCQVKAEYTASSYGTFTGTVTATGTLQSPGSGSYSATAGVTVTIVQQQ